MCLLTALTFEISAIVCVCVCVCVACACVCTLYCWVPEEMNSSYSLKVPTAGLCDHFYPHGIYYSQK